MFFERAHGVTEKHVRARIIELSLDLAEEIIVADGQRHETSAGILIARAIALLRPLLDTPHRTTIEQAITELRKYGANSR